MWVEYDPDQESEIRVALLPMVSFALRAAASFLPSYHMVSVSKSCWHHVHDCRSSTRTMRHHTDTILEVWSWVGTNS